MSAPRVLIPRNEIARTVDRLAREIRRDISGVNPLFICILKGSVVFAADLVRAVNMPLELEFVRVSSYGCGTATSGRIKLRLGVR